MESTGKRSVLHTPPFFSSLLSYFKKVDEIQAVVQRPIDKTRDFLLAPLGFTEILQVKEDLLVLVSRRKKVINKHTGEITVLRKPVGFQQLTLKFTSRDDWWRYSSSPK